MAFAYAVTRATVVGDQRMIVGTFTNTDTDSGGAIATGLGLVNAFEVIPTSHVDASLPKITISGGTVTVVCDNGLDGNWVAVGK